MAADRARLVNRIRKTLEDTNIKLASVVTDLTGTSSRAILAAMLAGEQNPEILAELVHRRLQGKREQLVQALQGMLSAHHRFLLTSQLQQLDFFDRQIRELDHEIAHRMGLLSDAHDPGGPDTTRHLPTAEEMPGPTGPPESAESCPPLSGQPAVPQPLSSASAIGILDQIPGVNERIGTIVVAEWGTQMDHFPDEAHLCSWVGGCPAANISANKRLSSKTGKGKRWLRQALIEAAHAAARSKETLLSAYYQRLRKRMGHKKALVALAHRILILISHLLKEQQVYRELGPGHIDEKAAEVAKRRALHTLEQLGYDVTLQSVAVA